MMETCMDDSTLSDWQPKRRGRKPKLEPDEQTLITIEGLAKIQCTHQEAAAVLGVCRETFERFLGRPKRAREAWEIGRESGKASLRRLQWASAQKSTTLQIWLGKQWLGQSDKIEEKVQATVEQDSSTSLGLEKLDAHERDTLRALLERRLGASVARSH
jgi:hypothetical protein